MSRRHERKSVVITTSLAFADWLTIFPNGAWHHRPHRPPRHHSEIIRIEGESYREPETAEAKETATRRRKKRP